MTTTTGSPRAAAPASLQAAATRRGRGPQLLCAALLVGLLAWGGWTVLRERRLASDLVEVRRLMDADQFLKARPLLARLAVGRPDDAEIAYRLGVCSHAAGRIDEALAAWERVDAQSVWATRAGLARARTLVGDLGRFGAAEDLLVRLLPAAGPARDEVRQTLAELLFWEGRRDEVAHLIERDWAAAADPVTELRDHWRTSSSPTLIEQVRWEVERAGQLAPDDDRVWLAKASLALQSGRPDQAAAWLDRCAKRRPDDPVVWRARLDHARTTGDLTEVRRCLRHLPADRFRDDQRLALRAWIAARRDDRRSEEQALNRWIAAAPGEIEALDRLATVAWESRRHDQAREYRARKARLDAARDRYRQILEETISPDHFAELARLAETLGRRFEARGWWMLRSRYAPSDTEPAQAMARLGTEPDPGSSSEPNGNTLAEQLADADPDLLAAGPDAAKPERASPSLRRPRFVDDAESTGLRFVFENGRSPQRQIPETTAGGVALFDHNGDGWLDVYVVQGGVFPPRRDPATGPGGDRLFRNRGDGTFEDISERSGIARLSRGFGHGVTVGDVDNDGHPDLFLTRWRTYVLLHNRGDGTFEDVTVQSGLAGDRDWPTSSAFADLDGDGDLDLYVCHYLAWDAEHPTLCKRTTVAAKHERVEPGQDYNYCTPRPFPALADHLFRNDGGRFVEVTNEAGIVDRDGRGLGVVAADVDGDGRVDLFVANDTTANYLWHNLGGMRFEELGTIAGVACNAAGAYQAGMGTAIGDLDGDGRPDLFVTNFYGESTTFFRNLGDGMFADASVDAGLSGPTRFLLGFGVATLDANRDGRLDLAIANGHVNDDRPDYPYAMPASLLLGGGDGRLADASTSAGEAWTVPRVARGLAVGDLDNDGRVDVVLLPQKSPLAYLHNRTDGGHFATFRLEGTKSNRDGIGAVVSITTGGRRNRAWRYGGGSYQSASDPRIHFGLETDRIDEVEVRWPSGRVDRHRDLAADRGYLLREGAAAPATLPGFGHMERPS
ncbi:MAG: FG-GAP-like repeat-containing protein [Isosphaeraceae bacterium]